MKKALLLAMIVHAALFIALGIRAILVDDEPLRGPLTVQFADPPKPPPKPAKPAQPAPKPVEKAASSTPAPAKPAPGASFATGAQAAASGGAQQTAAHGSRGDRHPETRSGGGSGQSRGR